MLLVNAKRSSSARCIPAYSDLARDTLACLGWYNDIYGVSLIAGTTDNDKYHNKKCVIENMKILDRFIEIYYDTKTPPPP